ncbi:Zn-dependent hydrolase [Elioraea thermophila]|uniref:Zn-dependent hydrolase n=1 Tax=Elioraea thermophila TaxID=2185104 RepID=UPI000DF165E5|nr:Zn-dependent hydrolase [Elioraea thermophila]
MRPNLSPDIALAERFLADLAARTHDGVGITREAYGPGERIAHALFRSHAASLGLALSTDHVGNLYATLAGTDRSLPAIIIGSHLDSVPRGGNYDGAAGVAAGLAVLAGFVRAGFAPARDLTVMAIRAEEAGAWFPTSYPGSRGALGLLRAEELDIRRRDSGRSLAEHMAEEGFDPEAVRGGRAHLARDRVAAFVELHIEQGPVLEAEGIPVGIVTGIPGSRRLRSARVFGRYDHSGATPRRYRADAAIAAAELAYRLDLAWERMEQEGKELVCTFCVLATAPEAGFTKIAGEARFELDVRSVELAHCDALFAELHALVAEIETRRKVRFELGAETGSRPALMDPAIRAGLARAAERLGIPHRMMPSGGGHDAAAFASAGIPAGMLFVRNQNGSHNPDEAMRMEDFAQACAVLQAWLAEAAA